MPVYCYRVKDKRRGCVYCRDGFEIFQKVGAQPLHKCPRCGEEVVKVFVPFSVGFSRTGLDRRAREKGFHKLRRVDKGTYEKMY